MANICNISRSVQQLIIIIPVSHLFMYELDFFFNPLGNYVDAWALPLRPSLFPFAVSNRQSTPASNPDVSRLLEVMNSLYSQVLSPVLQIATLLNSRGNSLYRISINPDFQLAPQYISPLHSVSYSPLQT